MTKDKPPLGLIPREFAEASRFAEVKDAITRYMEHGKYIPLSWIEEYNEYANR